MKRIIWLLLSTTLFLSLTAEAKIYKTIGAGVTRATLRAEGGKSEWGEFWGVGLEYSKPSFLFLGLEGAYLTKKISLGEKSWPTSYFITDADVNIGDVDIHGSFFDLAAKIGYSLPVFSGKIFLKPFVGCALSTQIEYIGNLREKKNIFLDPEERGHYPFDYLRGEERALPETSTDVLVGVIVSYRFIQTELRAARSLSERVGLWGLNINDKIDCFYVLVHYCF